MAALLLLPPLGLSPLSLEGGACLCTQGIRGLHPERHTEARLLPALSCAQDRRLEGDQESETSGMQDVRNPSGPGSLLRGEGALLAGVGLPAARLYAVYPEIPGTAVLQTGNARLDVEFWEF